MGKTIRMNRAKRQSIVIMLESIEHQIKGVKSLLHMSDGKETLVSKKSQELDFTNADEDKLIEASLDQHENDRDIFLQDIFREAQEGITTDDSEQQ